MNQFGGTSTQSSNGQIALPANWQNLPTLRTEYVAEIFHVKEQTVRYWACKDCGPIKVRPVKAGRKLLWNTKAVIQAISVS